MEHIIITPSEAALGAPTGYLVPDTREAIEMAVESFLARLDELDGDPDLEDATDLEDDFSLSATAAEAAASSPAVDLIDQDAGAYVEWHTRPSSPRRHGGPESMIGHEDAEEDDPAGQCDEDGTNTELFVHRQDYGPGCKISDSDFGCEEQGELDQAESGLSVEYGVDQTKGAYHHLYNPIERC